MKNSIQHLYVFIVQMLVTRKIACHSSGKTEKSLRIASKCWEQGDYRERVANTHNRIHTQTHTCDSTRYR